VHSSNKSYVRTRRLLLYKEQKSYGRDRCMHGPFGTMHGMDHSNSSSRPWVFTILQSEFKTAFLKVSTSVRKTQPLDLALMVTGISQPANLPWCFSLSQKLRDSARRNQSSHIVRVPSSPAANAASLALVLP
jgi:hypothetical protein